MQQHPQLRDLMWAVCSPGLIAPRPGWPRAFNVDVTPQTRDRLKRTDTRALEAHLASCNTRFLGSYFEALWEFFFIHDPRYTLVTRNLQIRDDGRTLGEFDFIVFDNIAHQHLQLELAIKFYLGIKETNRHKYTDGEHLWIGPQARDRLDIKIARALEHQLTLHQHPQAREQLRSLGVDIVEPQLLVKGYLFQPSQPLALPDYVPASDVDARWVTLDDIPDALDDRGPWCVLTKHQWLAPPYPDNRRNPLTAQQVERQLDTLLSRENRPYMIAQYDADETTATVRRRLFVTPRGWPGSFGFPR